MSGRLAPLVAALSLTAASLPATAADLLVSTFADSAVRRYDGATGTFLGILVAPGSGGLQDPEGMAVGPDGHLYVGSNNTDAVLRYDGETGAFLGAFVPSGSGGLDGTWGLTFGPDGALYVGSCNNHQVLRYHGTTGGFLGTFVAPGSGGLDCPQDLTFGPDGNLYVASNDQHVEVTDSDAILRYHGTTGASLGAFVPAESGGLKAPFNLQFGPDGNLYVADGGSTVIRRYRGSDGAFLGVFIAKINDPEGPQFFAFGPDGNLYAVHGAQSDQILRFRGTDGAPLGTLIPAGSGGLDGATGLLFTGACTPSSTALCLTGSRFKVEATWRTPQGQTGSAQAVPLTSDSGYFWFFNSANAELFVKVKDACVPAFNHFWVFAAGLTNVRVDLKVTDTKTGEFETYLNPLNRPFPPIQDTDAFATCP